MATRNGLKTSVSDAPAPVVRHASFAERHAAHLGWLVFIFGAAWDAAYHAPSILLGWQWPAAVDSVGEFGHVITLVGAVVIIFAVLRRHEAGRR